MKCSKCGGEKTGKESKGGERMPHGWKRRVNGQTYCDTCWHSTYLPRAVVFPVAGPVSGTWEEFRGDLAKCWHQSTSLATWAAGELFTRDVVRMPGDEKMPKMPTVYLYPEAIKKFPDIARSSLQSIIQVVQRKHAKDRYHTRWIHDERPPCFRYPFPFPVHNQAWKPEWLEHKGADGQISKVPVITCRLMASSASERRWTFRLRGGSQYRRQLSAFAKIISGEAESRELCLYRQKVTESDHRPGINGKHPGGGQRAYYRVMAKLSAWLPRGEVVSGQKTMVLRTTPKSFWSAEVDGRVEPFILNADHLVRWSREHRKYLDRISEDTKFEKRWPTHVRDQINGSREKRCEKQKRRIDSFCHEATAMLAKYCMRQGISLVRYDDSCDVYVKEFQWFKIRTLLEQKLDEIGCAFEHASGDVAQASLEIARKEVNSEE